MTSRFLCRLGFHQWGQPFVTMGRFTHGPGAKGVDSDTLMTARQRRRCVKKAHHAWAMEVKPKVAPRSIRRSRYAAVRIFRGRRR